MNKFIIALACLASLAAAGVLDNPRFLMGRRQDVDLGFNRLDILRGRGEDLISRMSHDDLLRQKFLLDILLNVNDRLEDARLLQLADRLVEDEGSYIRGIDDEMMYVIELSRNNRLLGKREIYTIAIEDHLRQMVGLYRLLVRSRDFDIFMRNACYARRDINGVLFVNALLLAVRDRDDTRMLIVPGIYEILPELYHNDELVRRVRDMATVTDRETIRPGFRDLIAAKDRKDTILNRSNLGIDLMTKKDLWMPWREMRMGMAMRKINNKLPITDFRKEDKVILREDNVMGANTGLNLLADDLGFKSYVHLLINDLCLRENEMQRVLTGPSLDISRRVGRVGLDRDITERDYMLGGLENERLGLRRNIYDGRRVKDVYDDDVLIQKRRKHVYDSTGFLGNDVLKNRDDSIMRNSRDRFMNAVYGENLLDNRRRGLFDRTDEIPIRRRIQYGDDDLLRSDLYGSDDILRSIDVNDLPTTDINDERLLHVGHKRLVQLNADLNRINGRDRFMDIVRGGRMGGMLDRQGRGCLGGRCDIDIDDDIMIRRGFMDDDVMNTRNRGIRISDGRRVLGDMDDVRMGRKCLDGERCEATSTLDTRARGGDRLLHVGRRRRFRNLNTGDEVDRSILTRTRVTDNDDEVRRSMDGSRLIPRDDIFDDISLRRRGGIRDGRKTVDFDNVRMNARGMEDYGTLREGMRREMIDSSNVRDMHERKTKSHDDKDRTMRTRLIDDNDKIMRRGDLRKQRLMDDDDEYLRLIGGRRLMRDDDLVDDVSMYRRGGIRDGRRVVDRSDMNRGDSRVDNIRMRDTDDYNTLRGGMRDIDADERDRLRNEDLRDHMMKLHDDMDRTMRRDRMDTEPNTYLNYGMNSMHSRSRVPRSLQDLMGVGRDVVDRKLIVFGEVLLHNIQQLLARINIERISMGRTIDNALINNPRLVGASDERLALRLNEMRLRTRGERLRLERVSLIEQRLSDIIEGELQRLLIGENVRGDRLGLGVNVDRLIGELLLGRSQGVGLLNILREIILEIGNVRGTGRQSIEDLGVLLQDPMVELTLRRLLRICDMGRQRILGAYKRTDLIFDGVQINGVTVDQLRTRMDVHDVDLINLMNSRQLDSGIESLDKLVVARQQRLNHKEFTISLDVNSERSQRAVMRVFLGPKILESQGGRLLSFEERRQDFVLLDASIIDLTTGRNIIKRKSRDIVWTTDDTTPMTEIYRRVMMAIDDVGSNKGLLMSERVVGLNCRYPHRLLLPRGRVGGLPMEMLVIVTPIGDTMRDDVLRDDVTLDDIKCSMGIGNLKLDGLPLGYPLDRQLLDVQLIDLPNVQMIDVMIYHDDKIRM